MEVASPKWNELGPIDLLYSGAEHVFNLTQGSIHLDKVSDFVETVTWNEPFIRALLSFQVLLFLVTYITWRRDLIQFGILFLVTVLALFAERLNEYGRQHWPQFASQNYFDRSGLFLSVFLSGPFVILANFIVVRTSQYMLTLQTAAFQAMQHTDKKCA